MEQNTIEYNQQQYRVVAQSYFCYNFTFNDSTIAPAATLQDSLTIENDSFFLLTSLTGFVTNAAIDDAEPAPLLTVQIRDTSTGRQMFNKPVFWNATVGVAQLPFILPSSTLFKQLTTLQANIVNVNSAVTYGRVHLSLIGNKVFVA